MRRKNQFTLTFFGLFDVSQVRVDLLKDICYGVAGSWVKLSLRNKRKGLMTIDQGPWSLVSVISPARGMRWRVSRAGNQGSPEGEGNWKMRKTGKGKWKSNANMT